MSIAYLLFNIFVISYPLLRFRAPQIHYSRKLKYLFWTYLFISIPHLAWDFFATLNGDWSFNPEYTLGFKIIGLPVEEILFFFTVPFACIFVYESVLYLVRERIFKISFSIFLALGVVSSILFFVFYYLPYTRTAFLAFGLLSFYIYIVQPKLFTKKSTYITLLIFTLLFFLSNTFLTILPIVLYSPNAILNIRLGSIPLEDLFFNFSFLGWFLIIYTFFRNRKDHQDDLALDQEKKDINLELKKQEKNVGIKKPKKVVVLGGGIGGLAVAILLKIKGFEVDVFEQNSYLGGKLAEKTIQNFRFDLGPSLLTYPQNLEFLFKQCGRNMDDYLKIEKLEITSKNFFSDNKIVNIYGDNHKLATEFRDKLGIPFEKTEAYLKKVSFLSDLFLETFLLGKLSNFFNFFRFKFLKLLFIFPNIPLLISLNKSIKHFFNNSYVEKIFGRFATYTGSSPYKSSGILNIIADSELNQGGFYVVGGIYSIIKALEKLGREIGVNFFLNSYVSKINTHNSKVNSFDIEINSENLVINHYDILVSNIDYELTYRKLLQKENMIKNYLKKDKSSSVIVFLLGVKGIHQDLDIHNVFFSDNYKEEFDDIFKARELPKDPTVYVNITSKYSKKDALKNCENWFVLVNTPSFTKFSDKEVEDLYKRVIKKISQYIVDLEEKIIFREVLTPEYFEEFTGATGGALYGLSANNFRNLFSRSGNRDKHFRNLYFVGGSINPGGGIPIVLQSAINCTKTILKSYGDT